MFSDGYVGPENDSDDEHADARRAGYTTVPSNVESDSDDEKNNDIKIKEDALETSSPSLSFIPANVQKEFQNVSLNNLLNVCYLFVAFRGFCIIAIF